MMPLIRGLLRPYRGSLAIILVAMLVQSTMTLAAPWPLKIIIDNVVVGRKLDPWIASLLKPLLAHGHRSHLAEIAALAVILIAILNAAGSYIANYYTESVGQWVANDLRMRTYHHLQYLSLRYYDTHQSGVLLSTITADVLTIQNFASSATLGILVDMFTILGMLVVMFFLNWDFTLIAVAITPLLLLLASRFKKAVKSSTHEVRKQQSNIVAVVQQDLESIRVVTAFGRQELEQASACGRQPGDCGRRPQSTPGQSPALAHRCHHRFLLCCVRALARLPPYPYGRNDRG
jgi:ABC-type multidrug transport system fused ATPase/permease subunit